MATAHRSSEREDPAIHAAREALVRGAFDEVRSTMRGDAGVDAEVRAHGIAALPGIEPFLAHWWSAAPNDPDLHLLSAIRRLDGIPWLAAQLGSQRTSDQQWHDEVDSLWRAVEHLHRTLAADPQRAVAKVWMAAVSGALVWRDAMPKEDFDVCAAAAEESVPESIQVSRWRIHLAGRNTDGSPAMQLAEHLAAAWGPGDPRHAEVATAQIDRYAVLSDQHQERAHAHWLRDDVHSLLVAANARFGPGRKGPADADASNVLAFTLAQTREPRLALPHLHRVRGQLLTWPWAMMQQPIAAYAFYEDRATSKSPLKALFRR